MRLPTRTPAACAPPARRATGMLLLALSLCAAPALATHYVVDLNGGGDFTTIQAGIDQFSTEHRDTVLVMPGVYAETMDLSLSTNGCQVISTAGALLTSVDSITLPIQMVWNGGEFHIDGFTFEQDVAHGGPHSRRVQLRKCVFRGRVTSSGFGGDSYPNFHDCDFYGPTTLEWCLLTWESLRFHGAPLTITHAIGTGSFWMRNCSFEGPADTLVYMPWSSGDFGSFERCSFSNARNGLVYGEDCRGPGYDMLVNSCVFRDLAEVGISYVPARTSWPGIMPLTLDLRDSRFERCGTAVRWVVQQPQYVGGGAAHLTRDTVLASTSEGLVLGPSAELGQITNCITQGGGSDGLIILGQPDFMQLGFVNYTISNSSFLDNRGSGIVVRDTFPRTSFDPTWPHRGAFVQNCTFANNDGAAVRMSAHRWRIEGCVALSNGEGFVWDSPTKWARLVSNTSVLNWGSGFEGVPTDAPDSALVAQRNLAAMNLGSGFRVQSGSTGSFAFNDAWGNYLTPYVGAWTSLDSNLTVDPRFCDLGAGNLGLQQGSPCGAGGVYGLIGALPETCPNTLAVEPPAPGALAFAVRPSIARGSVEFVPPATGAEGVVELFDVGGRVVWRAPLGPASGVVRWRGEGENGRVRAGLYWARFTRGSERATQRLVWLG